MAIESSITEQVIADLRAVDFEVERAAHSWAIFLASVRKFEENRQDQLIEALNGVEVGGTVNHLQMVLLHDCVSCICRATDEHQPDRITISSIALEIRNSLRSTEPELVKKLDRGRKEILKSEGLAELRVFRNNQLGHTLRLETPPTKYSPIPDLIGQISGWLSDAFQIFGYSQWVGQSSRPVKEERASIFWDCVEIGARAQETA